MKFSSAILPVAAIFVASVSSIPVRRDVPANLVPDLGFQAGVNPTGTGDCDGATKDANGNPVKVPCSCPPDQDTYVTALNANVAAGHAVNNTVVAVDFPTDGSTQSQITRINAALVTLQNLEGPGKGCPAASTTLLAQQKAIHDGGSASDAASATAASGSSATSSAAATASTAAAAASGDNSTAAGNSTSGSDSGTATADQVASLAPDLGFTSGKNPTGTGDCDGAVNDASGNPVKVPCSCPPAQDEYIKQLQTNVAAGKAVNNPSVAVTFPTDQSNQSQAARINAALVTLQNLNGTGKGCPAASTTLLSQLKAVQ